MANARRTNWTAVGKRRSWPYVVALVASLGANVVQWYLNYRAADDATQANYVGMSLSVLSEKSSDKKLREWAVSMLNKEAPVPFSRPANPGSETKYKQMKGSEQMKGYVPVNARLPSSFFEPPSRWKDVPPHATWGDLAESYILNRGIAQEKALRLCFLQHLIKAEAGPATSASSYIATTSTECAVEAGIKGKTAVGKPEQSGAKASK